MFMNQNIGNKLPSLVLIVENVNLNYNHILPHSVIVNSLLYLYPFLF